MRTIYLIPFSVAVGLLFSSCETTKPSSGSGAHKHRVDYWQNGGGACCPKHARGKGHCDQ